MSETSEFINHFEVSNFKKFDHLVVSDIGQFNLITGDNNVGKTSLLEALLSNTNNYNKLIFDLHSILDNQGLWYHTSNFFSKNQSIKIPQFNYLELLKPDNEKLINFSYKKNSSDIQTNLSIIESQIIDLNEIEKEKLNLKFEQDIEINYSNYAIKFFLNGQLDEIQIMYQDDLIARLKRTNFEFYYKPLIQYSNFYEKDLNDFFKYSFFSGGQMDIFSNFYETGEIVDFLNFIIPGLLDIKVSEANYTKNELIFVATNETKGDFVNITRFGDGVQKVTRYILELYYAKKLGFNYLLIDEIDTGIHFSKMKEFWKKFIQLTTNLKMQLFATTHSQECIEAYAQALEELGLEKEGRLITLKEDNQQIFANTKKFDAIKYGIENGYNGLG